MAPSPARGAECVAAAGTWDFPTIGDWRYLTFTPHGVEGGGFGKEAQRGGPEGRGEVFVPGRHYLGHYPVRGRPQTGAEGVESRPYARVPILLATGAVKPCAVVEAGEVRIRQQMKIHVTLDHRFIDGLHAAMMARTLRSWLEEPELHFGACAITRSGAG